MKLHIVVHESFEAPAAITTWANKNSHEVTYTHLSQGDSLPDATDGFDFLIVMGGPQSPATTTRECSYFDAKKEISFIRQAVDDEKFVLGICLGAQLLGEAFGAAFELSPNREIGVFEITLTDAGRHDPLFSTFPENLLVGHWHEGMPGLTKDSEILAYSEGCPRQIIKYTPRAYGFQSHFEFTSKMMEDVIQNCSEELKENASLPYVEEAETLLKHDFSEMNEYLFSFLDHIANLHEDEAQETTLQ